MDLIGTIRRQWPLVAAPLAIFAAFGLYKAVELADDRGTITVWSANYYYQRGLAAQRADDTEHALLEYRRALTRAPDSAAIYIALSSVYRRRDDPKQALALAETAVELARANATRGPTSSFQERIDRRDILFRALSWHARLADPAAAERDLNEVVERDGRYGNEHVWALVRLERMALARGALDKARGHLQRLLDESPDNTIFRFERARIAVAAGLDADALPDLTFVIDNAAGAMESMFIIGQGAAALGRTPELSPFDEIIGTEAVRKARLEALEMRARIRLAHGDTAGAAADRAAAAKLGQ